MSATVSNGDSTTSKTPSAGASKSTSFKPGLTVAQRLETATKYKTDANTWFAEGKLKDAIKSYHYALLYCSGINSLAGQYGEKIEEKEYEDAIKLTAAVHSNMAACYLKLGEYQKTIRAASSTLELDTHSIKAFYRRATAYYELKDMKKAAQDIDRAMEIAPNDAAIRELAQKIVKVAEDKDKKSKTELKGFLGKKAA